MNRTTTPSFTDVQTRYTKGWRERADKTVGRWLHAIGASPNGVTLTGAAISLGACVIWTQQLRWEPAFWIGVGVGLFGALFDTFDGSVARVSGKKTVFGRELDTILDRVVEVGMFAALAWVLLRQHHDWGVLGCVVALGGSMSVSLARNVAERLGLKGDVGVGARAERLVVLGVGVIAGYWIGFQWGVYAVALLAWITVVQRTLSIHKQLIKQLIDKGTP